MSEVEYINIEEKNIELRGSMPTKNLIKNSEWREGEKKGPKYFSGKGPITYDEFALNGYRTCSITMTNDKTAHDGYDLFIEVGGIPTLIFGLTIRTIDMTELIYVVQFFNENKDLISTSKKNVTRHVTSEFTIVAEPFEVPINARFAKVDWVFIDKVTACTYCAPMAVPMIM